MADGIRRIPAAVHIIPPLRKAVGQCRVGRNARIHQPHADALACGVHPEAQLRLNQLELPGFSGIPGAAVPFQQLYLHILLVPDHLVGGEQGGEVRAVHDLKGAGVGQQQRIPAVFILRFADDVRFFSVRLLRFGSSRPSRR